MFRAKQTPANVRSGACLKITGAPRQGDGGKDDYCGNEARIVLDEPRDDGGSAGRLFGGA
jgi:hypothetical protein